jgi:hypothetical protein
MAVLCIIGPLHIVGLFILLQKKLLQKYSDDHPLT